LLSGLELTINIYQSISQNPFTFCSYVDYACCGISTWTFWILILRLKWHSRLCTFLLINICELAFLFIAFDVPKCK
jgi:hypothetical protein